MGLFSHFLLVPPREPPANDPRANLILRCSESVVVAPFAAH